MIQYKLRQNVNKALTAAYGKWYAVAIPNETIDIDGLAAHMSSHNSPFSKGAIKGILTDMVSCIKEELTNGNNVRIDDLAIFKLSIASKKGCEDKSTYKASEYISGVRMRSLAIGELATASLNSDITLKRSSLDKDDTGDVDPADTGDVDVSGTASGSETTDDGSKSESGGSDEEDMLG
jgi:predicted histone-like DNA-binding protein